VLGSFGHGRSLLPVCRSRSQVVALPQRGPLPPEVLSSPAWPLGGVWRYEDSMFDYQPNVTGRVLILMPDSLSLVPSS
jgi:hypothetical protein